MPIGNRCRTCGATLSPDLGWCGRCLTPVTGFAARPPIHEPGTFVGTPVAAPRTSRWRSGPTTFGPVGRILCTVIVGLFFPWWGLGQSGNPLFIWALMGWLLAAGVVLRSVWKPAPLTGPPTAAERLRGRAGILGRPITLTRGWGLVAIVVVAGAAVTVWSTWELPGRYLGAIVAILALAGAFLARSNDL